MAVTITTAVAVGGTATFTELVEFQVLHSGAEPESTTWTGPNYPGTLDAFAARQADGANDSRLVRLVCGQLQIVQVAAGGLDSPTLTASVDATNILSVMLGQMSEYTSEADGADVATTGGYTVTIAGGIATLNAGAEVFATSDSTMGCWILCQ